jgi:hypothetical protein
MDHTEQPRSSLPPLSAQQLTDFATLCTGAPPDWPHRTMALHTLVMCCSALDRDYPRFGDFARTQLTKYVASFDEEPEMVRDLLDGRTKSYRFYSLLCELRRRHQVTSLCHAETSKLIGTWALQQYLTGKTPPDHATQTIKKIVRNPRAVDDPAGCVNRYLSRARVRLQKAIVQNNSKASAIGLAEAQEDLPLGDYSERDPVTVFNADLRRTWCNHIRDATQQEVHGTIGKDTLTKASLALAGRDIRAGFRSAEGAAVSIALQVITRLPARLLRRLPLSPSAGKATPLAWLDIACGKYLVNPVMFVELAKTPDSQNSALHLAVVNLEISLPPGLVLELQRASRNCPNALTLGEVIKIEDVNPRSTLVDSHGHRITLSRIQTSLPALAIAQGHHRWPVALGCQAWWLVSRGRRAYSVCEQRDVDAVINANYVALGWGELPPRAECERYIGSPLAPTPHAVRRVASFLRSGCVPTSKVRSIEHLNAWAAYVSFVLALALSLRARTIYPIHWSEIWGDDRTSVNDKDIAREPAPPIPVCRILSNTGKEWKSALEAFVAHCHDVEQGESALVALIQAKLHDHESLAVFSVDALSSIRPVGTDTWRRELPISLRLPPNFGRHFWPWRLQKAGVNQRRVDLLMRHKTSYMDHYSGYTLNCYQADFERLRDAMECELQQLFGHAFNTDGGNHDC